MNLGMTKNLKNEYFDPLKNDQVILTLIWVLGVSIIRVNSLEKI